MDIWHTCEPNIVGTEGWLGRALQEFDPRKENVVTGVSFGPSMFALCRCRESQWPASVARWKPTACCRASRVSSA